MPNTMKKLIRTILVISLFGSSADLMAQDFVYRPVNPAFGGDTFNYQWMLSSAQAQNTIADPDSRSSFRDFDDDPLANFQESLNRQILSLLSRQIVSSQFGDQEVLTEGEYDIGNFQIEINETGEGINVRIFDVVSGNETTVVVPFFND